MSVLQRKFTADQIAWVAQHPLFQSLRADIDIGKILPCVRNNEIHLYEGGARIISFSRGKARTHVQYARACIAHVGGRAAGRSGNDAGAVDGTKQARSEGDVALPDDLGADKFQTIREAALAHRNKQRNSELVAVHKLFPDLAVTRSAYHIGELALIDVEVRFGGSEDDPTIEPNMIDIAFLLPNRHLLFVEVKCVGNRSISSTTVASVEKQVLTYQRHIQRSGVMDSMNLSLSAQSMLVGRDLGHADDICRTVPVLILNPSDNASPVSRNNRWLQRALENAPSWTPSSGDVGIINGTIDPIGAIQKFVNLLCRDDAQRAI